MMTPESVCAERGIDLVYFDGRDTDNKGIYNKKHNLIAVDTYLDEIEKKKTIYHEIGHQSHDPSQYDRRREQYELQADRNMIHYLVKEELATIDDVSEFNYIRFMEKYKLKTMANETMVREEFLNLVG
ncbi:ImmA/IrrE family metallo-endopeptidase [Streptococcus suis]|uniref:ImmA/IrrE family metallo-endopeptidase n=1 Tax=Streptococcus suis TaxID=1307 RepID=UPI0004074B18|nr:ImmA/IrrE family metallo-endopeptidase [Streptococcus suis]MBO8083740.1 ImmA/IrrE family metallo-endopeptidase [Streptococcus suis]HEL2022478.1 ImmA/IrrE family metallo-endopeptidase [Streptococcus suis]HEM4630513.1 ImmA/IrrE family metallo-endopeptidase [Streptococcus suis]